MARSRSGTRGRRGPRKPPRRDGAFGGTGVQTLATPTFVAPDLGGPEAAAAAKAAGVNRWELAALRLAQLRGAPASVLKAIDERIGARLGR